MKIHFFGQPYLAPIGKQAGLWLEERLTDSNVDNLQIAVAWMKRSGLIRLEKSLKDFRDRGKTANAIIGIDEAGATKQGLKLAQELFSEVHILHDSSAGTFHPKVYLASGNTSAELLVGSNNTTLGGLFSNYEATLLCQLDLTNPEDNLLFDQVVRWFDTMYKDSNVCKLLDDSLYDALCNDPRYKIGDEDQTKLERVSREDYDGIITDTPESKLFGKSSVPKKSAPPRPTAKRTSASNRKVRVTTPIIPASQGTTAKSTARSGVLHWTKPLSASDAQSIKGSSKRTGNLRLSNGASHVDRKTFFRQKLFGDANWITNPTKQGLEKTTITFEVIINGVNQGQLSLDIDHADYRISGDNENVPTWLHWGNKLTPILLSTNYTGAWVVIERFSDDTYRLEITWNEPENVSGETSEDSK